MKKNKFKKIYKVKIKNTKQIKNYKFNNKIKLISYKIKLNLWNKNK